MLVEFVRFPLMFAAFVPAAPPVIPPVTAGADHVYVVPVGTIPLVTLAGIKVNPTPLHTVAVIGIITAIGFIVTVNVKLLPWQVPEVGVTV
jgi:hypothetical protein